MDARDRREILLMIQHVFERYARLRKPLRPAHKDTLRRLAEAHWRLTQEEGRES